MCEFFSFREEVTRLVWKGFEAAQVSDCRLPTADCRLPTAVSLPRLPHGTFRPQRRNRFCGPTSAGRGGFMQRFLVPSILAAGLLAAPPAARSETVRTIKTELSGADATRFAVENLLGTMHVTAGTGTSVEIVATVTAETAELADAVRLERIGGGGPATLRVRYPYDKVSTFRYREPSNGDVFIGWSSSDSYDYDGHHVRVNRGRGTVLHADLDIRVPTSAIQASFSSMLGLIDADGLRGELKFRVASADLRLRRLDGQLSLEGSSGDIRARDIKGSWTSDFSSGDCDIAGFEGDVVSMRTTSGDVALRSVKARR